MIIVIFATALITGGTHRDWQSLVLATASAVLTEGVCVAAVVCVVGGVCFRRLSGERSICLLSDPVGVLAPDLQAITTTTKKITPKAPQRTSEGVVALNTYMVTGLGARGDGDGVCSRSWVGPNP